MYARLAACFVLAVFALPDGCIALSAAKGITQYSHRSWQTDAGLPDNYVQGMAQTPDSYLWIATQNGLARFDGVKFTVFDKSNTAAMRDANVNDVQVDPDDNLLKEVVKQ